jgi:broad specificity phosphatase PhoE
MSARRNAQSPRQSLCVKPLALEMQLRDGLKEIRYGKWEDKTMDFVKEHYWDDYIHWLVANRGETSVEISSRASIIITEIQQKYATGNVLVVSHKCSFQ